MKKRLKEESVIFISIIKWLVLASIVGVLVGLGVTVFLKILEWATAYAGGYGYYFLFLPVAMFLSAAITKYLAPDTGGHDSFCPLDSVIESVHKRSGKIKIATVPVKAAATIVTLALGGSAGKEGPCAQIGAGISSTFADLLRFSASDRRKLVICGISGGFAAVFGTPIAGAIFGIEVLFVGGMLYEVLLPSFVAGVISYQVSSALGISYFYYPLKFVPVFSEAFFVTVVFAGIFFGICSFLLIESLNLGHKYSKKLSARFGISKPVMGLLGGIVLVVLTLIFSKQYLGLGLDVIHHTLEGGDVSPVAFIIKSLFTSITLNFGGTGGIVTPIFFVGTTAGSIFAKVLGLNTAVFAAIGLVSLLAGAANTPLAASILAVELFGAEVAPYAAVACVISFIMTGHRSVYSTQILAIKKSASINVVLGKEMDTLKPTYQSREKSLISTTHDFLDVLRGMKKKEGEEEGPPHTDDSGKKDKE
jgi:H+/Cl- antiporter ClcA